MVTVSGFPSGEEFP